MNAREQTRFNMIKRVGTEWHPAGHVGRQPKKKEPGTPPPPMP
jgi:hypothetical protein